MISPVLDKLAGDADSSRIEFYKVDVDDAEAVSTKAGVTAVCFFEYVYYPLIDANSTVLHLPDAYVPCIQRRRKTFRNEGCHTEEVGGACLFILRPSLY
jgi:hypothetical protein